MADTPASTTGTSRDFDLSSDEEDDIVHWQDEITRVRQDQIPKKHLDILQHDKFKFAKTELEEQTWGKFVEPVIVSTVLGGLIYLFFSNR